MPKSTKIHMLRNTSTNTCHEVNLCVTIAYGTYTLSLQYYGVTWNFKVCCVRVEKSPSPSDTKEGCRNYSGLTKFNQI